MIIVPGHLARPKKNNELSLCEKAGVLKCISDGYSIRTLGAKYNISTVLVSIIEKHKLEIETSIMQNELLCKKILILRKTIAYNVNILMWRYFLELRIRNKPISGQLLKEKAKFFTEALGIVINLPSAKSQ